MYKEILLTHRGCNVLDYFEENTREYLGFDMNT